MTESTPSSELNEEDEYFSEEESETFKQLSTIGRLRKTISLYGHQIEIATLTVDEDLQVGLAIKPFADSHAFSRAFKLYTAAAAIKSINGVPLVQQLASFDPSDVESVELKAQKLKKYFPVVIDEVYAQLAELEKRLIPVLSRLGKTFG